jgi:hypothetical protein
MLRSWQLHLVAISQANALELVVDLLTQDAVQV